MTVIGIHGDKSGGGRGCVGSTVAIAIPPGTEGTGYLRMESRIIFAPGDDCGSTVFETVVELSCSGRHCKVSALYIKSQRKRNYTPWSATETICCRFFSKISNAPSSFSSSSMIGCGGIIFCGIPDAISTKSSSLISTRHCLV